MHNLLQGLIILVALGLLALASFWVGTLIGKRWPSSNPLDIRAREIESYRRTMAPTVEMKVLRTRRKAR